MVARPADAVANDYFRARRFIGSGDRRAVSDRVWRVLRSYRRLSWWLGERPRRGCWLRPRCCWTGRLRRWLTIFSGGRFAPAALAPSEQAVLHRLEGRTLDHPSMPDAVRLEVPDWLADTDRRRRNCRALLEPASLDLRVNLLKATREEARAALAAEGLEATPTPLSPWGLRIDGRRQITTGAAFRAGLVEIQDEGSQLVAALVDARPGHARGRHVRRCRRQDAGAGDDDAEPRPDRRLRCIGRAAGWRGPAAAARRRAQRRAPSARGGRQMGQAPGRQVSTACWWMRHAPAPAPGGAIPMRGCG